MTGRDLLPPPPPRFAAAVARKGYPPVRRRRPKSRFLRLLEDDLLFLALLAVFSPPSGAVAQAPSSAQGTGPAIIRAIRVTGARALNERDILGSVRTAPGSALSLSQLDADRESLLRLYHARGYFCAEALLRPVGVDSASSSGGGGKSRPAVDLAIEIREGESYTIGAIRMRGISHIRPEKILGPFETRTGAFLDQTLLEQDINALLAREERIGFPFAKVEIESIGVSPPPVPGDERRQLEIALAIDEGPRVTIDEIRVSGNTETRSDVIIREARIALHEAFDGERVSKIPERLARMNIFTSIKDPQVFLGESGRGGLMIAVEEANPNTFDGLIGYAPPSGGGSAAGGGGGVSGMVDVTLGNLFGTARRLDVRWQRDDSRSQEMTLRYVEPWLLGLPVNMTGLFRQRKQDSLYVRRDMEAVADLLVTESFSIGGVLAGETIIPSGSPPVQAVSGGSMLSTGIAIRYDTRDDPFSPAHGIDYRTRYQIGARTFRQGTGDGAATVQKVSVDIDGFGGTFDRQVIALGFHGRQTVSGRLEISDLYRFGGTNSLRGYRENSFLGSRVAWMNTEYRFLLARRSFFFGFVDWGYADIASSGGAAGAAAGVAGERIWKVGYGIGIRMETSLGNIGVSVALGEGDSFAQGKIHVGLLNRF